MLRSEKTVPKMSFASSDVVEVGLGWYWWLVGGGCAVPLELGRVMVGGSQDFA
jgi:hypothetical protein